MVARLAAIAACGLVVAGCLRDPEVRPWPATTRRGFNIACWARGCFDSSDAVRTLERAAALGASDVALVFTWYAPDASSGAPAPDPQRSPSFDEVARAASRARSRGLSVILKPHVDRQDGGSRTQIVPADRAYWWEAYRGFALAAADLAAASGARSLAIGTELSGVSPDVADWRALIADARTRFGGEITYAANWDELEGIGFLDTLDAPGVDGYFPLAPQGGALTDLVAGWQVHLARLEKLDAVRERGLMFTEVGAPADDEAAQAQWYRAALAALSNEKVVLVWNLWEGSQGGTYVALEPALEEVMAAWAPAH